MACAVADPSKPCNIYGAGVESNPSEWLVKQLAAQDGVGKSATGNAFNLSMPGQVLTLADLMEGHHRIRACSR